MKELYISTKSGCVIACKVSTALDIHSTKRPSLYPHVTIDHVLELATENTRHNDRKL